MSIRRFFQFRLVSLLLLTSVCCLALVWRQEVIQKLAAQQAAVAKMTEMGASIQQSVKQPQWLAPLIGRDIYLEVDEIRFRERNAVDLSPVSKLLSCQRLYLENVPVKNKDLRHIRGLPNLKRLSLIYTHITNAGVEELESLTSLKAIDLGNTKVDDEGIAHLSKLPELTYVGLSRNVSKDGLRHLANLPKLKHINLNRAQLSGDALALLKNTQLHTIDSNRQHMARVDLPGLMQLPRLRHVKLWGLTNDDIAAIAKRWPRLVSITGNAERVTDDCVDDLLQLKRLNRIELRETQLSSKAIATITKAFPSATIAITTRTAEAPFLHNVERNYVAIRGLDIREADYASVMECDAGTESLYLFDVDCDESLLAKFAGFSELDFAWPADCAIRGPAFDAWRDLPKLEFLKFSRATLDEDAIRSVSRLPNLERLTIENCRLPDNAVEILSQCKSLRELSLSSHPWRDQHVADLSLLTQVTKLAVQNSDFDDADCESLLGLKQLEYLDLSGTIVTKQGVERLKTIPNLQLNPALGFWQR